MPASAIPINILGSEEHPLSSLGFSFIGKTEIPNVGRLTTIQYPNFMGGFEYETALNAEPIQRYDNRYQARDGHIHHFQRLTGE